MKASFLLVLAAILGPAGELRATTAADGHVTIAVIGKSEANPVFRLTRAGAERAAADFGASHHVRVLVDWATPKVEDPQTQADTIHRLTAEGINGIAVACSDRRKLSEAIDGAVAAGVPVACYNSDAAGSRRFYFCGADDAQIGTRLMTELAKALGGRGVIGILAGNPRAPNLLARAKAVQDAAQNYPNIVVRNVFYSEETPGAAKARIAQAMRDNPDITGWALIGGWSLFADHAYDWNPGQIKCVSVASMPEQLDYVRSGYVQAIVVGSGYDWGYRAVTRLLEKIVDHRDPGQTVETLPITVITAPSVDSYAAAVTGRLQSAPAAETNRPLVIGLISKSGSNQAFAVVRQGAEAAAAKFGPLFGLTVKIEDLSPPNENAKEQVAAIQKLLLQGADGIDIACSDAALLAPAIDEAVEAGLPVATFGSDAPGSKRFFCYLADNEQCGDTEMVGLAKLMNGHGVVAILGGRPESENLRDRVEGAKKAASLYPGIKLRGVYPCSEAPEAAAAEIQQVQRANPEIGGWIMVGSWAMSAPNAFPWRPGQVHCVSVGILPSQLSYVRDRHVDLVVAQPYFQWGYRTTQRLIYKIVAHRNPASAMEISAVAMVSHRNVDAYGKWMKDGWNPEELKGPWPLEP